jgi:hypothetical protein
MTRSTSSVPSSRFAAGLLVFLAFLVLALVASTPPSEVHELAVTAGARP